MLFLPSAGINCIHYEMISMKQRFSFSITILTFIISIFIHFNSFSQVGDTLLSADEIYSVDTTSVSDSLNAKAIQMLNDPKEAEKILNESGPAGMLDSLTGIPYFKDYYFTTDTSLLNIYNFPVGHIPTYPDSVYRSRIEKLDHETPIDLTYNQAVKSYIELYALKKRGLTSKFLGLKEIYFPLFEEYLDKYDLPLELKYLAVVESALNPVAGSRAGAKGLWQFMYFTGKLYGLKVTSMIDERFDPYKATDAACRHLKDLYALFGDWNLVMAAYNSGSGNVNKAIRRAGGVKNYWAIWPFLPKETRGYVPAFIAVEYVMNYAPEHNLYPMHPGILYDGIDTVIVKEPLAFDQISEMINIPMEDLRFLNPMFKSNIIPAYDGKVYSLRLPKEYINPFIDNEIAIYNYKSKSGLEKEKLVAEIKKSTDRTYHVVRKGENLGLIAGKYHVSVTQLKQWNGLRGNTIHPGQKLTVIPSHNYTYVPSPSTSSSKQQTKTKTSSNTTVPADPVKQDSAVTMKTPVYHTVRSGENLAMIAGKYGCSVENLHAWNNLKNNTIYPNQRLVVKKKGDSTASVQPVQSKQDKKYIYYTVKKGDTLWDIANKYSGVTVNEIRQLNNLSNSSKLQPGQKLKIAIDG